MTLVPNIPSHRLDGSPSSLPYFLKGVSLIKSLHFTPIWESTASGTQTNIISITEKQGGKDSGKMAAYEAPGIRPPNFNNQYTGNIGLM